MKALEELDISPTPWKIRIRGGDCDVVDNNDEIVFEYQFVKADTRFAAAAPKMYKALYKITKEQECGQNCDKCSNSGCVIKECKAALAEASGESEAVR